MYQSVCLFCPFSVILQINTVATPLNSPNIREFTIHQFLLESLKKILQFLFQVSNSSRLMEILKGKEEIVADLEKSLKRLKEDQVDQSRLQETMQSDKVAASRAVAQNRELKKQLEELEKGFVDMVSF